MRIGLRERLRRIDLFLTSLQVVRVALRYASTKPGIWGPMTVSGRLEVMSVLC